MNPPVSDGGVDLKIAQIYKMNTDLVVHVVSTRPGYGCIVTDMVSQSYKVVALEAMEFDAYIHLTSLTENCDE